MTPRGREAVSGLVGRVDPAAIEAEISTAGSALLGGVEHPLIPPELAPVRFLPAVRRLIANSRFEQNVFCMTRFPTMSEDDPVSRTIETLRATLALHGLTMHVASDRNADDELFGNVAAHIWGCKFGIALLESLSAEPEPTLNDNMLIEVGAMLVTGRRCALLKDVAAPSPPTDFVAQIYKDLDLADQDAVATIARAWVVDDLGLDTPSGRER